MHSSPRKNTSFTKVLRIACASVEILLALGLVGTAVLAPFAESYVLIGSRVTITKDERLGGFSYAFLFSGHHGPTVTNEVSAATGAAAGGTGSVSVGPYSLSAIKADQLSKDAMTSRDASLQKVEGMVTFSGSATATEALHLFIWPALMGEFCKILMVLAFFEMLQRLLSSSEKGELFTDANVRTLRQIGFILIALDLIKFASSAVLMSRMNAFVAPFFSAGWVLPGTMPGRFAGAISGVLLLLLAEIFREGLKFRKDSDLTI
jgi:hypothetical protein